MSAKALKSVSTQSGLTRGQRLWSELRDRRDTEPISLERARLLTASFKETEGLPTPIRRAKAFEKIVSEIPIYIDDGQLLAGDFGARPMAAELFPEHTVTWMLDELKTGCFPYKVTGEGIDILQEIATYWKDKAVREAFIHYAGEEELQKVHDMSDLGAWIFPFYLELQSDKGWTVPNYPKVVRKGLLGILAEVEEELDKTPVLDDGNMGKVIFLKALRIVAKAAIGYASRYATLATELARKADGKRKSELQRIAKICERVPAHPAESFYEALQAIWFCHLCIFWDTKSTGIGLGRVDQYLYPYYQQDLEKGRLNQEEAVELLECLRVKMSAQRQFESAYKREAATGEAQFHNCTLGGQTGDGRDATNELSFLWIEAAMRTRTPHPTLSVRWHKNLSPDFALKAAELCRLGMGFPAWFGDATTIPYLLGMGATLEEARDYAIAGCVLHVVPNKTATSWPLIFNMPKVLELILNNCQDPKTKIQFTLPVAKFEDLETFADFCEAYKKVAQEFIAKSAGYLNQIRLFRSRLVPHLFSSLLLDDCIQRGQDPIGGGCHYQGNTYLHPVGVMDVVDSLVAIKKCLYEERVITKQELTEALASNFKGRESLRNLLLSAPKYGNDIDTVDNIAADLYRWMCEVCSQTDAAYGVKYVNSPHSVSWHGPCGSKVGALPSGRLALTALADGGISPCQGMDMKGPTAVMRSAGKIDHLPMLGTLLNMKLHPSNLETREDLQKFLALLRTYFDDFGGKHAQFNIVSKETLVEAQAHPERHRNLIVRVAGYSALWVELSQAIQDEIILRTQHTLV